MTAVHADTKGLETTTQAIDRRRNDPESHRDGNCGWVAFTLKKSFHGREITVAGLQVDPQGLHAVGGVVAGAAEQSALAPGGTVDAPANDPVSMLAAHRASLLLAGIGAYSAHAAATTRAVGGLAQDSATAYAEQEALNEGALRLGSGGASSPVPTTPGRMDVPALSVPPVPAPPVAAPPASGKQIAQLIHGGTGTQSQLEAADRLSAHAAALTDTADLLRSARGTMAGVWPSETGAAAQTVVTQLADRHTSLSQIAAATAQAIRGDADSFAQVRRETPPPQVFDDLEARLRAADAANRQCKGMYTPLVAQLQTQLADTHRQAITAYADYTTRATANGLAPSSSGDIPGGPDDSIVGPPPPGSPRFQPVDRTSGPMPQDPSPPPPPPVTGEPIRLPPAPPKPPTVINANVDPNAGLGFPKCDAAAQLKDLGEILAGGLLFGSGIPTEIGSLGTLTPAAAAAIAGGMYMVGDGADNLRRCK